MTEEQQSEYKTLLRKCQEAYIKHFDRGNFNRIHGKSVNLYNNRLAKMQQFCIDNQLTESRWLKFEPLTQY
jgi:hypothetical protein